MASRFELIHHPEAAQDFQKSMRYFQEIDEGLAKLFQSDFQRALQGIASGKLKGKLVASAQSTRWEKLDRFSHKVFFEPADQAILVLGLISGRRHPTRIRLMLTRRGRTSS
jgi:hypothetical protein